jgi:hypothetical protein
VFVAQTRRDPLPQPNVTVDEAIEQFLTEHLLGEKGREPRTVDDYRRLHLKWFAPWRYWALSGVAGGDDPGA